MAPVWDDFVELLLNKTGQTMLTPLLASRQSPCSSSNNRPGLKFQHDSGSSIELKFITCHKSPRIQHALTFS